MTSLWYLLYTNRCALSVKEFATKEEAELFAGRFTIENLNNRDDFCIDMLFEGKIHSIEDSFGLDLIKRETV